MNVPSCHWGAKTAATSGGFYGKDVAASAEVLKQGSPLVFIAARDSEFENMRCFYRNTVVKVELQ